MLLFSCVEYLKSIDFLRLYLKFTCSLLPHFQYFKIPPYTLIYRMEDPSNEVYFLLEGSVYFKLIIILGFLFRSAGQHFYDNPKGAHLRRNGSLRNQLPNNPLRIDSNNLDPDFGELCFLFLPRPVQRHALRSTKPIF